MRDSRKLALVAIMLLPLLALAACDRKITRVEQVAQPTACFNCHGDTVTTIVAAQQQWENSRHASGMLVNEFDPPCSGCHTGNGFIARTMDQANNRIGSFPAVGTYPNPETIHCFACHAPHTNGNLDLRWTQTTILEDSTSYDLHKGNTCGACHRSRRSVNTYVRKANHRTNVNSTHWGPHDNPQADMLLGSNGYEYANFTYEQTEFHRTLTENGCLDCHMKTTSNNVVGGHSFNMEAELDGETIQNTAACEACHESVDDFNIDGVQDEVVAMAANLKTLLQNANLLDADGAPVVHTVGQDSAGALWNYLMVESDRSEGVHNANYIKGLLQSSIDFLSPPDKARGTVPLAKR
jgi:hypothetical protein